MTRILLIQGPNLNWLGRREPEKYGRTTAAELDAMCRRHAETRGYELAIAYHQVEGEAIRQVYAAAEDGTAAVVMNPAGMTYAGYAMRDCLRAVREQLPYVEVHLMHLGDRGTESVPGQAAAVVVHGMGVRSYLLGLEAALMLGRHPGWYDVARDMPWPPNYPESRRG